MKKIFRILSIVAASVAALSCGPSKHAIHVEMRHPSKAGMDLAGKVVAIVCLENQDSVKTLFSKSLADGFAYTLEQDYGTGEGSVGIYGMPRLQGGNYASKDTLVNLIMDTGADVVFLLDTVSLGTMTIGGASHVAVPQSVDSSYVSEALLQYTIKMYGFDAMDENEKVYAFGGTSNVRPAVYSDGKQGSAALVAKAYQALPSEAWEAGTEVGSSFKSQWKHEQYSITYFDKEIWYKALDKAEQYDWKGAMDIWFTLLDTNDVLKRSCAEYNISVACYMLGDMKLAASWLDRSDADSKLPISDALRKRINARK